MIDLKLDSDNNLYFDGYDLALVSERDEVIQRVVGRLYSIYGEWVFDPRLGLPRFGEGGIHDASTPMVKRLAMLRRYIATTPGVKEVTNFDVVVDPPNHGVRVVFAATTVYDEPIEGEVNL